MSDNQACQIISYCLNNVDAETRDKLLHCDLIVVEDFCLQRCGRCFDGPFLLVDDTMVIGASHSTILNVLGIRPSSDKEQE